MVRHGDPEREPPTAARAAASVPLVALIMTATLTSGCAAVGLTALGVGTAVGVNHTLNGIVYRTFSEPLPKVKRAALPR